MECVFIQILAHFSNIKGEIPLSPLALQYNQQEVLSTFLTVMCVNLKFAVCCPEFKHCYWKLKTQIKILKHFMFFV